MAKVNNGNLLQHFVECAVADALAADAQGLRLVATHAMEPFGTADVASVDDSNRALRTLLSEPQPDSPHPLLRAYAHTKASPEHYPNTAELVAALTGDKVLSGVLCEFDGPNTTALTKRWAGSQLEVRGGSWRATMKTGAFDAPPDWSGAWLLTLDPYTWLLQRELRAANRGPNLCREDLESFRSILGAYAQGEAPGAFCAFVYKLDPEHSANFRRVAIALADRLGLERSFLGLSAGGEARHVGVLMSPTPGLVPRVAEAWAGFREAYALR